MDICLIKIIIAMLLIGHIAPITCIIAERFLTFDKSAKKEYGQAYVVGWVFNSVASAIAGFILATMWLFKC